MADQDIIHTAEIIKAAIPYVDSRFKGMAELFAKALDLMGSLKSAGNSDNVAAYGFQSTKIDIEGLLKGIRPICSLKEQELVDRILNIFNMKRMFEMYNNMMATMKAMQEFDGFNFSDAAAAADADTVAGNFTGSNFESIFQNFGFTSAKGDSETSKNNESDIRDTSSSEKADSDGNSAQKEASDNNSKNYGNSGNGMNNKMFDMLKAMVPPEQMSTFENLSMLFNTMSYDNNSKQDDSKEQNNG